MAAVASWRVYLKVFPQRTKQSDPKPLDQLGFLRAVVSGLFGDDSSFVDKRGPRGRIIQDRLAGGFHCLESQKDADVKQGRCVV